MIGIVVVVVVTVIFGLLAWKILPWVVDRLGVVDGVSITNKVMIFVCFCFAIFLLWLGMPAFSGTVKFMLFGRSFADLFRWGIFKENANLIGDFCHQTFTFTLWVAVNLAELYPRIVRGNREGLEAILAKRRAAKARAKMDPDDDIQERLIKHQIRTSGVFSMADAYIVCFIGFALDTAIAVANNPAIQNNAVMMKLMRLGSINGSTQQHLVILGFLICGMTVNSMIFDKFNYSEQQLGSKKKPSSPST